ncbi:Protein F27D9.2, partial [Aphelenchoides avenae]
MHVGLAFMVVGNLCYLAPQLGPYFLLFGRFVVGFGAGNLSLLRSYASTASTVKDRPKAIAFVTCGQALGQTGGAAFQLLFTPLSYPGFSLFGFLPVNMYTALAYFAVLMNIVGAVALHFWFTEEYVGIVDKKTPSANEKDTTKLLAGVPKYDIVAVVVCNVTRFVQLFVQTNLQTLGTPLSMTMFGWSKAEAVTNTSIAQGVIGGLTLVTYVGYTYFKVDQRLSYRMSCLISIAAFVVFHVLTFSYPFLPGHVATFDHANDSSYNVSDIEHIGCDAEKFTWCDSLAPVNEWVYYGTYVVVIGLAYPFMNIALMTLFSKILGPRRQGTQQGIMQTFGSAARMTGPVAI